MKKIYLMLLLCFVSVSVFATKIVCPSTLNGGSGGGTVCQNGAITLSFTLTTCTSGTNGSSSQSNINVSWYVNSTNSTSGGTLVSGPTASTTSTTTYTYIPSTSATGTFYYYPVVTWTATGTCQTSSTVTASGTQSVTVTNSGATVATIAASKTGGCTPYNSTLSLTGVSPNGISYQWQSSSDDITFSPISGATAATYAATVNGATFYECSVGCALGAAVLSPTVGVTANLTAGGTANATTTSGCGAYNTTLSLTGATTGAVYQWQSSSNNVAFTPVTGATANTYAPSIISTIYYDCNVSCASSTLTSTSASVQLNSPTNPVVYASLPFNESFETAWTTCAATGSNTDDRPNSYWTNTLPSPAQGNNSWRRNDDGASAGWTGATGGAYTPAAYAGTYSARFHSYESASTGSLDLHVDLSSGTGSKQISFAYINPDTYNSSLQVLLSTDGGATFPTTLGTIGSNISSWTTYTYSTTATSATSVIRFKATGTDEFNDLGIDNINITLPCSGQPTAGTTSASTTVACSFPFSTTLSLSGSSSGIGITYQWQSSSDGTNFNPISNATNSTYATTAAAATYYNCIVSCTNSALSATSTPAYCYVLGTTYATLPFTESFETAWGSCSSTDDRPNQYWTNVNPATGNNSWRRNDDGASAGWTTPTGGAYSPNSSAGTYSARYHSYYSNGTTGTLDLHVDMSSSTYPKKIAFDYIQEDVSYPSTNLSVLVSTDGGSTFPTTLMSLGQNVQSWTTYTMTTTSTSATTVIRFFATGSYGNYDIGLDNINVISLAPTLSVSPTSLSYGNVGVGLYSPSQSFNLSGTYLTGYPGSVTITAPSNFQVSSDNSSWGGTASIPYAAATLAATPVYVRFNPAAATAYSGYVTAGVTGANTASVSVTGTGALPCSAPSDQPSAINFSGLVNTSATATLTDASPPTGGYMLIASIGAFTGTIVNGTTYSVGSTIGNGTVVGTSATTTVNMTGLIPNATNTITVFPYSNSGTCAGPVYNTVNPLTGIIATCLATPTSVSTSNIASGGFALNWTASSGATSYQVDVATNSSFSPVIASSPFTVAATLPTVATTIGGLQASTVYYYRITAIGGNCNSVATANASVTTTGGTSITITSGFNYDVIANGAGTTAPLSTNIGVNGYDGQGWVYYSNDFYVSLGGTTGFAGLPMSGSFTSAATTGMPYQLANYSANNCLWLPATASGNTGTLNFATPVYASTIYVLGNTGSGGTTGGPVTLKATFTDNTIQSATVTYGDWYTGTPIALALIGRVGQTDNFDGSSGSPSGPNFDEKTLAISSTNYTRQIQSLTVTTNGSGAGNVGIFAVSIRNGTLSASAGLLAFGNTTQTCTSSAQTFSVSGSYLYPSGGSITVIAPTGFLVSSTGTAGTYAGTANLAYTSTTITNALVYVEFNPTITGTQSGNITFSGGTVNNPPIVAVSGVGTVAPVPQSITGTTTFCYGAVTSSPLGETVAGGTWGSSSPTVATVDNSGNLTIAGLGTTTITYSLTTCNITNTVSTLVTVLAAPVISVTPSGPVTACGSQTLTTGTGTGYQYQWYNASAGIINGETNNTYSLVNTGSVPATDIYSVQVTNSVTGCGGTSPGTMVTLNPVPTASVTPSGAVSVCGSEVLTAGTNFGNAYQWYNSSGIISGATNNTYSAINTSSVSVTDAYSVQAINNLSGCGSTSAGTAVTLGAIPMASVAPSGTVTACGSQTLTAVTDIGNQYQWYNGSGVIAGATNNTYVANNTGSVSATDIYSVQVTNSSTGCNNTSGATMVTLNPMPTSTITTPGSITSVCGSSIVMTANTDIGDTYQWSNSSGNIVGATNATYVATATGTYSVNILESGQGCNTNSANTVIIINAVPTSSITPVAPPISCGSQLLTAGTDIGNAYQWYNGSGIITGATGSTYIVANTGSVITTNTYSVVVTNSLTTCNSTSAATTVTLDPVPTATITTPGNITANCDDIVMTANTNIGDTYQWSNSSGIISGATNNTYTATASSTYSVNIKKGSTGCNVSSAGVLISIVPPPSAAVSPSGTVTTCGSQLLTAVTDFGNAYQWYNSSGIINGATNSTYTAVNAGTVSATNSYSVAITNTVTNCGNTSAATTVTLNPTPTASVSPTGTVTACGTQTLTAGTNIGNAYQWYNSSGAISGATNGTYALNNTGSTSVTNTYSVQVTNTTTNCNAMSAGTMVILNAIPTASVTPAGSVTVCGSQLLTVVTNIGNKYQWYNSGGAIGGATNSTYLASNAGSVSSTTVYSVQVTNSLTTCTLTSSGTTVTLNPVPTASVSPSGTVTTCGTQTLTGSTNIGNAYQWYSTSGIIGGATNSTYILNNTGSTSVTNTYSVQVTNTSTNCNVMSAGTTVILNAIPTASVSPTGTVTACGSQLLTAGTNIGNAYQWYSSTSGAISGATNSTYMASNTSSVSTTIIYSVQVTNSATNCNLTSAGTAVKLNPIPTASISPTGTVTNCGSQVLSVSSNIGNIYQWYNGSGAISGATNSTYAAINSGSVSVTNTYSVVVTNSVTNCNTTSTGTTVILNPGPTSIVSPSGTVTACGSELLTALTNIGNAYQWYSSASGAIGGATNSTYTVNNTGSVSVTNTYSVVVTNSSTTCNSTSPGTTVIVNPIPTSSVSPTGTVTACGSQVLTAGSNIGNRYQWYNGSGIINGATNNTYTANNTGSTATTDVYSVTVTSSTTGCNSTSTATTVILNAIPTSSVSPPGTVTACGSELLTAGTNIGNAYQWYSSTSGVIGGATNSTYTVNNTGSVSVTAIYSVMVTNGGTGCNLTSAGTTVIVNPIPTASVTPAGPVTACGHQLLTAVTDIGNKYQWYNGSGIINGATNNTYTAGNTGSVTTTDVYSVMVTSSTTGCNSTSPATTVILNAIPTSTVTTAGGVMTNCGSLALTGASNIGDAYQWYNSGGAINGATTTSYTATVSSSYYMRATNTATGCDSNSVALAITINPYPVVTVTTNGPTTFCAGSGITLTANNGYNYQWQNYGVNIGGATNHTYTSSGSGIFRVILSTNAPCIDTTTTTTVTVNPMPSEVITAEGPVAFCTGSSVTLSAQTGLVNYQWVDPVNGIGGANGNSYTATASGSYRVALTGTGNCRDTSIVLVVTALPLPANGVNVSGATTFCAGGSVTLTAPAGLSYQWEDGVTAIAGAVGQSYTTGVSGNYKVLLSDGQCSDSSLVTGVTNASPDTSLTVTGSYRVASGELTFCSGGSLTFSGTAGAGSYRWDSGTAAIPGANGPSYIVTGTGLYTLIMGSSFGCTDSVWRKIEVDTLPDPVIYAYGYGLQTTGVYVSYQWYLNGAAIPGATNRDYLATTQGPYTVLVTDANGCSGMSASTTLNNLNVGAVTGIDISLYPNPSSSVVYIESPVKVNAVVYTIEGQEVIRKADAKDVDLSRLANGTYMIKLTGEDGTLLKIGKLVKSE